MELPSPRKPRLGQAFLLLAALTLLLFVIRAGGPSDLLDSDQERPAAYVLDAVVNGHWWCQSDWTGDVMSKPPLFAWIGAAATVAAGQASLWTLYAPCLAAMLLTVGLLLYFGGRRFGPAAGFLAGLVYLLSPSGVKHIALARTDALFAATITLTGLMGFLAWQRLRSWVWFWLAAALATLTKGPLGLLLGSLGFLAWLWNRVSPPGPDREEAPQPPPPGGHVLGIALFLMITGGWFWLAYRQAGQAFIDKVILRELVGHIVDREYGSRFGGLTRAPLYWLSRFLPWSLLAIAGLWRAVRQPASEAGERDFERFLCCWLVGGLIAFSLATHQRGDLELPLNSASALLAGRELAFWLRDLSWERLVRRCLAGAVVALAAYAVYLHLVFARHWEVRQSEGVRACARRLAALPSRPPMLYLDSPYALQFYLGTMQRQVGIDAAAAALKSGSPRAVAVAGYDRPALTQALGQTVKLQQLDVCPGSAEGATVVILSNQPVSHH